MFDFSYSYELGPRAADVADARGAGGLPGVRDRRRLPAADVRGDRHPDDLHGAQGLRGVPVPPGARCAWGRGVRCR